MGNLAYYQFPAKDATRPLYYDYYDASTQCHPTTQDGLYLDSRKQAKYGGLMDIPRTRSNMYHEGSQTHQSLD